MINHQDFIYGAYKPNFIYGAYECEGGYRICAKLDNTDEWQDCQALFGNVSTRSLWITYSTKEKALAVAVQLGLTVTKLVLP